VLNFYKSKICLLINSSSNREWITQPVEGLSAICESLLMLQGNSSADVERLISIFENADEVKKLTEINCEVIPHPVCRKVKVKIKVK